MGGEKGERRRREVPCGGQVQQGKRRIGCTMSQADSGKGKRRVGCTMVARETPGQTAAGPERTARGAAYSVLCTGPRGNRPMMGRGAHAYCAASFNCDCR